MEYRPRERITTGQYGNRKWISLDYLITKDLENIYKLMDLSDFNEVVSKLKVYEANIMSLDEEELVPEFKAVLKAFKEPKIRFQNIETWDDFYDFIYDMEHNIYSSTIENLDDFIHNILSKYTTDSEYIINSEIFSLYMDSISGGRIRAEIEKTARDKVPFEDPETDYDKKLLVHSNIIYDYFYNEKVSGIETEYEIDNIDIKTTSIKDVINKIIDSDRDLRRNILSRRKKINLSFLKIDGEDVKVENTEHRKYLKRMASDYISLVSNKEIYITFNLFALTEFINVISYEMFTVYLSVKLGNPIEKIKKFYKLGDLVLYSGTSAYYSLTKSKATKTMASENFGLAIITKLDIEGKFMEITPVMMIKRDYVKTNPHIINFSDITTPSFKPSEIDQLDENLIILPTTSLQDLKIVLPANLSFDFVFGVVDNLPKIVLEEANSCVLNVSALEVKE